MPALDRRSTLVDGLRAVAVRVADRLPGARWRRLFPRVGLRVGNTVPYEIRLAATVVLEPRIGGSSSFHLARYASFVSVGVGSFSVIVVVAALVNGLDLLASLAGVVLVVSMLVAIVSMLALEGYELFTAALFDHVAVRIGVRALGGPGALAPSLLFRHGHLGRITRRRVRRARLDATALDTLTRLLPEWSGTLDELIAAARSL